MNLTPYLEYQDNASNFIRNLDPRVKIICALAWSFLVAALDDITLGIVALAVSAVLVVCARWNLADLLRRLGLVNVFVLFMWLMIPFSFSSPGEVVASFGFLKVTREGLDLMILLTLKTNAIVIALIALLVSSPLFVLAQAGRSLGISAKLIDLFLLTTRYIYVIFDQYQALRQAMRLRGFRLNLSKNALNGVANLLGSLLVRSLDRAERIHRAMLCRGYTGTLRVEADFSLKISDAAFGAVMGLLIIAIGGAQWLKI